MDTKEAQELFKQYLYRRYGDRSTPKHYLSDLRIFLKQVGEKPLKEVNLRDIDGFVDQQHTEQMAATTINRRLATLHAFFECLAVQDLDQLWPNPVNWRRHRVKESDLLPRDASEQEVEQLFSVIESARDAAIFGLMVGAGLRVEEVACLQVEDLEPPTPPSHLARLRVRGKGHKERVVWVTPKWYAKIQAWLEERPPAVDEHLFLNQHQRRLSKDGIQYWLKRYCHQAGIAIRCHQLRHTFARRLADKRMPIESISKLLGHAQVVTTQRYTLGADPHLQEQFQQVMVQLETEAGLPAQPLEVMPDVQRPRRQEDKSDLAHLEQGLRRFDGFPAWLYEEMVAYINYRWHGWKPHMAAKHTTRTTCQMTRIWQWMLKHREITGWSDLQPSDLERWLDSRRQAGLSALSQYTELCDLRAFLKFVQNRDHLLNPNLFRVTGPACPAPLPKHLSEAEYERLLKTVQTQTAEMTLSAMADRAWFLTLAHTGMRINELLDLRLADLDFSTGRIFIASAKNRKDRIAFMTPTVANALQSYLTLRPATDDDHLWRWGKALPSDEAIRRRLRQWGKLCQVNVTPHQLRHTFATRLINRGMSLESVRKLLGHTSLQMSQHYARLYDSTVQEQFASASAVLEGISVLDWPSYATTPFLTQDTLTNVDSV
jgi:site-specific recombinase XerD